MCPFRLMIVDDEPWALRGVQTACDYHGLGFDVVFATTEPSAALAFILASRPDVVITDISMDGMTGIELMKHARAAKIDAQFVVVSGFSEFEYARSALRMGAFAYLLKPISKDEFHEVMWELANKLGAPPNLPDGVAQGNPTVAGIKRYLEENYSEEITLGSISERFFLSPNYLCDLFKAETGRSIMSYLRTARLNHAAELLRTSQDSVADIALRVGYSDISYFGRLFRNAYQMTPGVYRRAHRARH